MHRSARSLNREHRAPIGVVIVAAIGAIVFLGVPIAALLQRAPWSTFWSDLSSSNTTSALWLSVKTSSAAAGLSLFFGVPIAIVTSRRSGSLIRAAITLPLVLPPVVGGAALLFAFGRRGLVGQWLYRWFDLQLPFTTAGVVLAEAFVALPFLVVTVDGALRSRDRRLEAASATLGGSRWFTLRHVTLPAIAPSIVGGVLLAWARALGEFGATLTFAGSFPGTTQTLPLAVFFKLEGGDPERAVSLSVVLLVVAVLVLAVVGRVSVRSNRAFVDTPAPIVGESGGR